jgi:hypothetical protein
MQRPVFKPSWSASKRLTPASALGVGHERAVAPSWGRVVEGGFGGRQAIQLGCRKPQPLAVLRSDGFS